jgi:hypothetical protein
MGNDTGTYPTTLAAVMRAYDKLPPVVRRALADAVFDWVPQPLLTRLRRDGWSPEKIVEEIALWDREELREREQRKK